MGGDTGEMGIDRKLSSEILTIRTHKRGGASEYYEQEYGRAVIRRSKVRNENPGDRGKRDKGRMWRADERQKRESARPRNSVCSTLQLWEL